MKTETFEFVGYHGLSLPATLWLPEQASRCILQITHGMTEHICRYETFVQKLTEHGILVTGFDLREHGRDSGFVSCF